MVTILETPCCRITAATLACESAIMRGGARGAAKGLSDTRAALRVTMTASGLLGVRNEASMSCLESGVPLELVRVGVGG